MVQTYRPWEELKLSNLKLLIINSLYVCTIFHKGLYNGLYGGMYVCTIFPNGLHGVCASVTCFPTIWTGVSRATTVNAWALVLGDFQNFYVESHDRRWGFSSVLIPTESCKRNWYFLALVVVWGCARGATVTRYLRGNRGYGACSSATNVNWLQKVEYCGSHVLLPSLMLKGPVQVTMSWNCTRMRMWSIFFENRNHGA